MFFLPRICNNTLALRIELNRRDCNQRFRQHVVVMSIANDTATALRYIQQKQINIIGSLMK